MKRVLQVIVIASIIVIGGLAAQAAQTELVVFHRDLVQVTETSSFSLLAGEQTVYWEGLLPKLFVSSLHVEPVDVTGVTTISFGFVPEGIDLPRIWEMYAGRYISFQQGNEFFRGKLLRISENQLFLQPDTHYTRVEVIERNALTNVAFDSLPPAGQYPPRIGWRLQSNTDQKITARLSYLSPGADWRASYLLQRNADSTGTLKGTYSIQNTTGRSWHEASITLIAGSPLLSTDERIADRTLPRQSGTATSPAAWFDFQRYVLPAKIDLLSNATVQIPFPGNYSIIGEDEYRIENATTETAPVVVEYRFHFKTGQPPVALPWGEVSVYGIVDGSRVFLGEGFIPASTSGSEWSVRLGTAFDVTATKTRSSYRKMQLNDTEESFRFTLTNAKSKPITLILKEFAYGAWRLESSRWEGTEIRPVNSDATSIEWSLRLPANSQTTFEYTLARTR